MPRSFRVRSEVGRVQGGTVAEERRCPYSNQQSKRRRERDREGKRGRRNEEKEKEGGGKEQEEEEQEEEQESGREWGEVKEKTEKRRTEGEKGIREKGSRSLRTALSPESHLQARRTFCHRGPPSPLPHCPEIPASCGPPGIPSLTVPRHFPQEPQGTNRSPECLMLVLLKILL